MSVQTLIIPAKKLLVPGISNATNIYYQENPEDLVQQTLDRHQGELNDTGALVIKTGEFTAEALTIDLL